jgi:hypothetical protein
MAVRYLAKICTFTVRIIVIVSLTKSLKDTAHTVLRLKIGLWHTAFLNTWKKFLKMFINPNNLVFFKNTLTPTNVRVSVIELRITEVMT